MQPTADEGARLAVCLLSDCVRSKEPELGGGAVKKSKRKVLFLTSLVALLTFTSALLLALAPPPLAAGGYDSLAASDRGDFLDAVFKTAVPAKQDRWKYIYVHHSGTSQVMPVH
jgi:hypothetical protein